MATIQTVDRRTFLKVSATAGGGLVVGGYLRNLIDADPATVAAAGLFEPNVWVKIAADDSVTIMLSQLEMGQGVMTSMPMLVAEELDADWKKIKTEWTPADAKYGNPNFGGIQLTAGSNSVRGMWQILRTAGGTARAMLVTAAAGTWGVDASTCSTEKGEVVHRASGRRLRYGALVDKAAALAVPKDVVLKDPKDFRIIGTRVPGVDNFRIDLGGSSPQGVTSTRNIHLVGPGSGDNLLVQIVTHLTVNANGEVTASVEKALSVCV